MQKAVILFLFFGASLHAVNKTAIQTMENEPQSKIEKKAQVYAQKYNVDALQKALNKANWLLVRTQFKFQDLEKTKDFYNRREYISLLKRETGLKLIIDGIKQAIEITTGKKQTVSDENSYYW